MKKLLIATLVLAALPFTASAQDANANANPNANANGNAAQNGGWTGSGEFGFASARGNSRSENANAKLGLSQENELWKNNFFLNGLRSKGDVEVQDAQGNNIDKFSTTANRYDTGASVGYKFDPRSYVVTAARYEHDDFGANTWQGIVSVGYGYIALKNERAELSFEIGPGFKRYQPARSTRQATNADGTPAVDPVTNAAINETYTPSAESEVVGRGLVNGKYRLTDNTALEDTLLIEAGSKNQYYQNDIGVSVSMTKKMALKVGYQIRYNSNTQPGTVSTDKLMTTNLVYNF